MADRMGLVRTESLGKLVLRRSADFVSNRRKFGTLGRRGDMDFLNDIDEGGGDGVASMTLRRFGSTELRLFGDDDDGAMSNGERGLEEVAEQGSISGSGFEGRVCVFSWKSPPPLRIPP